MSTSHMHEPFGPEDPLRELVRQVEERRTLALNPSNTLSYVRHIVELAEQRQSLSSDISRIRSLVNRELAAALDLLGNPPDLNVRKVACWAFRRVRDVEPSLPDRQLWVLVAEGMREVRTPARPTASKDTIPSAYSTVLHGSTGLQFTEGVSIVDWAKHSGPVAEALASSSRDFCGDADYTEAAEMFLLVAYAGLNVAELSALFGESDEAIVEKWQRVEELVQADVAWVLRTFNGTPIKAEGDGIGSSASGETAEKSLPVPGSQTLRRGSKLCGLLL